MECEGKKKFLECYQDACFKREILSQKEVDFNQVVSASLLRLEHHDKTNKRIQTGGSAAQVGIAAAVIPTGGIALAGNAVVGVAKWGADVRCKGMVKKHWDRARNAMTQLQQAFTAFEKAARLAYDARDEFCEDFPDLKPLSMNVLMLVITCPGVAVSLLQDAAWSTALFMATEHPETTLRIIEAALITTVQAATAVGLTAETALGFAEFTVEAIPVVVEAIPFVGLGINLEKLRRATTAQRRDSENATLLREAYQEIKENLKSAHGLMQEFERLDYLGQPY